MTRRLLIIGAGGFGREVLAWARDQNVHSKNWNQIEFVDDDPKALDGFPTDAILHRHLHNFAFRSEDSAIVAVADPTTRKRVFGQLDGRVVFDTVIHPTAYVGPYCKIGAGSILCPHVVLTTNVVTGAHVQINVGCTLGHDVRLGAFVTLSPHVSLGGGVIVEECAFLGTSSTVLPRARVGASARVGAGSVVLRAVEGGSTVVGVPARRI